jgi:hypothetical protein
MMVRVAASRARDRGGFVDLLCAEAAPNEAQALRHAADTRGRVMRNPEVIFLVFRAWNAWRSSQPAHKFSPTGKGAQGGSPIPKPL